MKNKLSSTITLFIVLVLLGIIAWRLMATQETALNKDRVLKLSESDIFGFDITKVDPDEKFEKISVRKNPDNNWVITFPVEDITDPGTISIMTASLKDIRTPTIIKNVADLSEYGLDKPVLTVVIHLRNGKMETLNFGSESPIPEMYYARLAEKRDVVVIGKDIKNNLSPKLDYLRERKILNLTREQVHEFAIKVKQGQVCRIVNTNGKWILTKPYEKELPTKEIDSIVEGLNALWAHGNDDDLNNLAKYGLDQPKYQVDFILADGKSFSLIANRIDDDYYIFNSLRPTIFKQMNPEAFSFLVTTLQNLLAEDSDK